MLPLLFALVAPAHAADPSGAFWGTAGVSMGAGLVSFLPGVAIGIAVDESVAPLPGCEGIPRCNDTGNDPTNGLLVGGPVTYGVAGAAMGGMMGSVLTHHGGRVFLTSGAVALVSAGLIGVSGVIARDNPDNGAALYTVGALGEILGVPLAAGFAAAASAEDDVHAEPRGVELSSVGLVPTEHGAVASVGLTF